jgi:rhodanese-related sulfurtransferase
MAPGSTPPPEVTFVTPEHLKARLDAGEYLCLIDERESDEFGIAHIPGARWCSHNLLVSQVGREVPTTYVPVVVYCHCGEASMQSVPTLRRLGYAHIFVIQGGFLAWCAAGFPIETGLIDSMP